MPSSSHNFPTKKRSTRLPKQNTGHTKMTTMLLLFVSSLLLLPSISLGQGNSLPPTVSNTDDNVRSRPEDQASMTMSESLPATEEPEKEEAAERFKQTFSFLKDSKDYAKRKFKVHFVEFPEGNYTGELGSDIPRQRDGWGEMMWNNGTLYGPGNIFVYSQGDRYVGQWKRNLQHGIGTFFSQTGAYIGDWAFGLQSGNGTALYHNGNKYVGQFLNGFKHGYGVFTVTNGDKFTGFFQRGRRHGQGIEVFANGERYAGEYVDDLQNGFGTSYYANGQLKYVGEWAAGMPHGNGTFHLLTGVRFAGGFQYGRLDGAVTVLDADGVTVKARGVWRNGVMVSSDSLGGGGGGGGGAGAAGAAEEEGDAQPKMDKDKEDKNKDVPKKRRKSMLSTFGNMVKSVFGFGVSA